MTYKKQMNGYWTKEIFPLLLANKWGKAPL